MDWQWRSYKCMWLTDCKLNCKCMSQILYLTQVKTVCSQFACCKFGLLPQRWLKTPCLNKDLAQILCFPGVKLSKHLWNTIQYSVPISLGCEALYHETRAHHSFLQKHTANWIVLLEGDWLLVCWVRWISRMLQLLCSCSPEQVSIHLFLRASFHLSLQVFLTPVFSSWLWP